MEIRIIPIRYGFTTLVGVGRERPVDHGNCFELCLPDDVPTPWEGGCHVANMYYENFKHWQETTGATDVEVSIIDTTPKHRVVLVTDSRIPLEWRSKKLCKTCLGQRAETLGNIKLKDTNDFSEDLS